ncbi:tautomerase family protein [Algihabitans albus]|uniref:tautomerase family protein n=1 Tax=Algihabitans albus TaxID=2164067 RepID=UPI000E5D3BAA|nr:tautomerase family protein [Algihabitans albus]
MPLARISVPAALPAGKTRKLADAVHDGLVATCNVPLKDRFQLISVFESRCMIIDRNFPDVNRTSEASIVEILFLEGRSVAQKTALFQHVAAGAIEAGFVGDDIMIVLSENAPRDWSLGCGRSYGRNHAPDGSASTGSRQ